MKSHQGSHDFIFFLIIDVVFSYFLVNMTITELCTIKLHFYLCNISIFYRYIEFYINILVFVKHQLYRLPYININSWFSFLFIIYFDSQFPQIWPVQVPSRLVPFPFDMPHKVLRTSFISWHHKVLQVHLVHFCTNFGISHFFKES